MPTSYSTAGKATFKHEASSTFDRVITIKHNGVAKNLTGATIEVLISDEQDGEPTHTLTVGEGLIATDLANGKFRIYWQTKGVLEPRTRHFYKAHIVYPDGKEITYLDHKIVAK